VDGRAKVYDWRSLLPMLADIRAALDKPVAARLRRRGKAKQALNHMEQQFAVLRRSHEDLSLTLQIIYALINVGGEFQTSEEVMEQSAEVLTELLEADLFVCACATPAASGSSGRQHRPWHQHAHSVARPGGEHPRPARHAGRGRQEMELRALEQHHEFRARRRVV
jgi:hypothetical protein